MEGADRRLVLDLKGRLLSSGPASGLPGAERAVRSRVLADTASAAGRIGLDGPLTVEVEGQPDGQGWEPSRLAAWALSGVELARMNRRYRSDAPLSRAAVSTVYDDELHPGQAAYRQFQAVEKEALFAKQLIDRPRRCLGPRRLAKILERRSRPLGVTCETLPITGGVGAGTRHVGRAAAEPPQIVCLTYSGSSRDEHSHLWLCGKGITMDTGGLGLKGQAGMRVMKTDMAGAAVAAGAVFAAARLQVPINVTAAVAVAENAIGPLAMAPGDLIRYPGGATVEVTDTDSEGRLVLADLCLLAAARGASTVLTIGTLTELISWTIGRDRAGLQTSNADLARQLQAAGSRSGEPIWHLPIPTEHSSLMDGGWVDLVNSAGPAYGGIQPALFLERFATGLEWGHLEICGPSFIPEWGGTSATGYGVGLLVEFMQGLQPAEADSD